MASIEDIIPVEPEDPTAYAPPVPTQRAADAARAKAAATGNTVADIVPVDTAPKPQPGILSRAWRTLTDPEYLASEMNLSAPHIPGTSASQPLLSNPQFPTENPLMSGVGRGLRDVYDTAREHGANAMDWAGLTEGQGDKVADANAAARKAFNDQYGDSTAASIGRVIGQVGATAGPLGLAGRGLVAGANAISGPVGSALRFLTSATPADTMIPRAIQQAAQGAGTGGGQAALTSSADPDTPVDNQILRGAGIGGVVSPVIGGLTKAADVLLRGFSGSVDPGVAALAQKAKDMGVEIPAGKLSTNQTLRIISDQLGKIPGSGSLAADLNARRALQSVVANQMGETANNFAPEVMNRAATRIGNGLDDVTRRAGPVSGGPDLTKALDDVENSLPTGTPDDVRRLVAGTAQRVRDSFAGGYVDPEAYIALTNSTGPLANAMGVAKNQVTAAVPYLGQIESAVQDRLAASAPPGLQDELAKLRYQWRVMKTVQPLAEKATVDGDIPLGQLQSQVVQKSRKYDPLKQSFAYQTADDPLDDAARIGKRFFGSEPESGTAGRGMAMLGLSSLSGLGPALYYDPAHALGLAALTTLGGGALAAGNRALQANLRRPGFTQNLIDTSLGAPVPDISRFLPLGANTAAAAAGQFGPRRGLLDQ
jgi:hypothetical protein